MQLGIPHRASRSSRPRLRAPLDQQAIGLLVVACILFVVPVLFGRSPYFMQLGVTTCLFAALAESLNLITGMTGPVSFAHAAFYAIGAYASALLALRLGLGFWGGFIGALVLTAALGLLLGLPTLRLGGSYLAIATIGLQVIVQGVLLQWVGLTNGPTGITNIMKPTLFGWSIEQGVPYYLFVAAWLCLILLLLHRITRSRLGYELLAIREDERAALAIGVPVSRLRVAMFTLAAALAGGTGSLYAHYIGSIDPYVFDLTLSATVLVTVLLGGRGSIIGVLVSAALLTLLPEYLQVLSNYRIVLYGAGMLLLTLFFPKGLAGLSPSRWLLRPATPPPLPEGGGGRTDA